MNFCGREPFSSLLSKDVNLLGQHLMGMSSPEKADGPTELLSYRNGQHIEDQRRLGINCITVFVLNRHSSSHFIKCFYLFSFFFLAYLAFTSLFKLDDYKID